MNEPILPLYDDKPPARIVIPIPDPDCVTIVIGAVINGRSAYAATEIPRELIEDEELTVMIMRDALCRCDAKIEELRG